MTLKETLIYWRKTLSCEEQVKRQLSDEYANADTNKRIEFLDCISKLIYKKQKI